jgi:hypothetical protein
MQSNLAPHLLEWHLPRSSAVGELENVKPQVQSIGAVDLPNPSFPHLCDEVSRHARRGEEPEIAAALLRRFVLRRFSDQQRELLAFRQTLRERLCRIPASPAPPLRGGLGCGKEEMAGAKSCRLREPLEVRRVERAAFFFRRVQLRRDLLLDPLLTAQVFGDLASQRFSRETDASSSDSKALAGPN